MEIPNTPLIPAQAGDQPNISLDTRLRGDERVGKGLRWVLGAVFAILLTACGQAESEAQEQSTAVEKMQVAHKQLAGEAKGTMKPTFANTNNDVADCYDGSNPPDPVSIKSCNKLQTDENWEKITSCIGVFEQGGMALCRTAPYAKIVANGTETQADHDGWLILGFDRDATKKISITTKIPTGVTQNQYLNIAPREYTISRIDGLPPSQVSTFTDAQLKHIRASSARKKKGFASREQTIWFKDGFTYPLKEFKKTSPFGAQRILNGEAKKPHYGVDIAAPVGTPIYAPADGTVSLADNDLYFEGAMVLLDHGQGLISMYLHMSAIDVKTGQVVKRGDKLGEIGSRGRSTGPHLCWRLKWRNRHLDPELLTKWPSHEHENE